MIWWMLIFAIWECPTLFEPFHSLSQQTQTNTVVKFCGRKPMTKWSLVLGWGQKNQRCEWKKRAHTRCRTLYITQEFGIVMTISLRLQGDDGMIFFQILMGKMKPGESFYQRVLRMYSLRVTELTELCKSCWAPKKMPVYISLDLKVKKFGCKQFWFVTGIFDNMSKSR